MNEFSFLRSWLVPLEHELGEGKMVGRDRTTILAGLALLLLVIPMGTASAALVDLTVDNDSFEFDATDNDGTSSVPNWTVVTLGGIGPNGIYEPNIPDDYTLATDIPDGDQVGRCEQTDSIAGGLQQFRSDRGNAPFAIRAGDSDRRVAELGVPQQGHQFRNSGKIMICRHPRTSVDPI